MPALVAGGKKAWPLCPISGPFPLSKSANRVKHGKTVIYPTKVLFFCPHLPANDRLVLWQENGGRKINGGTDDGAKELSGTFPLYENRMRNPVAKTGKFRCVTCVPNLPVASIFLSSSHKGEKRAKKDACLLPLYQDPLPLSRSADCSKHSKTAIYPTKVLFSCPHLPADDRLVLWQEDQRGYGRWGKQGAKNLSTL